MVWEGVDVWVREGVDVWVGEVGRVCEGRGEHVWVEKVVCVCGDGEGEGEEEQRAHVNEIS